MDEPDHGAATFAPLDEVLEDHQPAVLLFFGPMHESVRRVPDGHGGPERPAGQGHAHRAALTGFDLVASHEPRIDARASRDRLPHLVRRRVEPDLLADFERLGHGQGLVARVSTGVLMLGCTATITR